MAHSLGKPAPQIQIDDGSVLFRKTLSGTLNDVFMHLFRNSLDHGIETIEERRRKRKDDAGSITIELHVDSNGVLIIYQDDGAGLNMEKLRKKGREGGIIGDNASLQEVAEVIFAPGLTTKEAVSEISGRGVGMDAVRSFLAQQGCSIRTQVGSLISASHCPVLFEIRIPLESCYVIEAFHSYSKTP